jgi:hypothetical protein
MRIADPYCPAVLINDKVVELNQENKFEDVQMFDKLNVTTHKVCGPSEQSLAEL